MVVTGGAIVGATAVPEGPLMGSRICCLRFMILSVIDSFLFDHALTQYFFIDITK